MQKKKLLLISLLTILFIAIFHYMAIKYSWYWTYKWMDIPVHIVGGFWVSLTSLWVALKIKHIDNINGYKKKALLIMLSSVFIIAILWEIFELVFKVTSLNSINYWQDTLGDIFNSFIGGVLSFLYFIKNKKTNCALITKFDDSLSMPLRH
jgi:hypothetical protein